MPLYYMIYILILKMGFDNFRQTYSISLYGWEKIKTTGKKKKEKAENP